RRPEFSQGLLEWRRIIGNPVASRTIGGFDVGPARKWPDEFLAGMRPAQNRLRGRGVRSTFTGDQQDESHRASRANEFFDHRYRARSSRRVAGMMRMRCRTPNRLASRLGVSENHAVFVIHSRQ